MAGSPSSSARSAERRVARPVPPVPPRILATPAAEALIARLVAVHGPLMFHQSGGCCDGSAPMCFVRGEFRVGGQDVLLGHVGTG